MIRSYVIVTAYTIVSSSAKFSATFRLKNSQLHATLWAVWLLVLKLPPFFLVVTLAFCGLVSQHV